MSIKSLRVNQDEVLRVVLNDTTLWDADVELMSKNLVLWLAGLNDDVDKSTSNHTTLTSGNLGTQDHLEFRNTQFIDLPGDIGYSSNVSVMTWFKHRGTPNGDHHILLGGYPLELTVHATGYLRTGIGIDNVRHVQNFTHPSRSLTDGAWHHIGYSFDGVVMRRFIDGDFVGETTLPPGTLMYNVPDRRIGRFGSSAVYGLNADVFDLRVYKDAKSDTFFSLAYQQANKETVGRYLNYKRRLVV